MIKVDLPTYLTQKQNRIWYKFFIEIKNVLHLVRHCVYRNHTKIAQVIDPDYDR